MNKRGYTLVELMIGVVVMGILLTIPVMIWCLCHFVHKYW